MSDSWTGMGEAVRRNLGLGGFCHRAVICQRGGDRTSVGSVLLEGAWNSEAKEIGLILASAPRGWGASRGTAAFLKLCIPIRECGRVFGFKYF